MRRGARRHQPRRTSRRTCTSPAPRRYVDDLPELAGTLHAALGLSPVAHGRLTGVRPRRGCARCPASSPCSSAADIPGATTAARSCTTTRSSPTATVRYLGQPVFAVIADTRDARGAPRRQAKEVLEIEPLPRGASTPEAAHAPAQYVLPPMHLVRGDARAGDRRRAAPADAATSTSAARSSSTSRARSPTRSRRRTTACWSTARPSIRARCSTWSRTRWACTSHHVQVRVPAHGRRLRRQGVAVGAVRLRRRRSRRSALQRPVKLRARPRRRLPGHRPAPLLLVRLRGRLRRRRPHPRRRADDGLARRPLGRPVGAGDDARALPLRQRLLRCRDVAIHGYSGKTNTQSNTAFRGFGGPQGAIAIENILDSIARRLGQDPLDVRRVNFYGVDRAQRHAVRPDRRGQHHPRAGRRSSRPSSDYRARRAAIAAFNATSPVLKRGLALTPVKFGISFNVVAPEPGRRAGARLHRRLGAGQPRRHRDGPGPEHQGGAGGGARARRRASTRVRVTATDTQKVANTSATAASTGSRPERQGGAGRGAPDPRAPGRLRRAAPRRRRRRRCASPTTQVLSVGTARTHRRSRRPSVARGLHGARAALVRRLLRHARACTGTAETMQGKPFFYFAYGAAVSEVVVDTLTGEWKLLRADVLHDVGRSLNPADRHRPGRGRLHPGHGLADDRGAGAGTRRPAC